MFTGSPLFLPETEVYILDTEELKATLEEIYGKVDTRGNMSIACSDGWFAGYTFESGGNVTFIMAKKLGYTEVELSEINKLNLLCYHGTNMIYDKIPRERLFVYKAKFNCAGSTKEAFCKAISLLSREANFSFSNIIAEDFTKRSKLITI